MKLSIVGMSGLGKSYWSKKLEAAGVKRFCCDDAITRKLDGTLRRPDGTRMDLGEWMGFPFTPGYKTRERIYLQKEGEVLKEIFDYMKHRSAPGENVVVDTTGSVIYTGHELIRTLRRLTRVVHLQTTPSAIQKMLDAYLAAPRPVIWGEVFVKQAGETNEASLGRCYPSLLSFREALYRRWADASIDYDTHIRRDLSAEAFLELVA